MRKIDYGKIKWDAATNWEFCGSKENLREVWDRASECEGVRLPIEEFGYRKPSPGHAYGKGDIVTFHRTSGTPVIAVVDTPVTGSGYFKVRFADGSMTLVHPSNLNTEVEIADIPEELIALARAEAGKPLDLSKCPLKKAGACMEGREA